MQDILTFNQFGRAILKYEIIQDIRFLKAMRKFKNYKNDDFYNYCLKNLQKNFKNRQNNDFSKYPKLKDYYSNYLKNKDIKK